MSEGLTDYTLADSIIEVIKSQCGIEKPNAEMTSDEIGIVMRHIGRSAPDTTWLDDKPIFGRTGIGVMLSLTLYAFPDHYIEYELWQKN